VVVVGAVVVVVVVGAVVVVVVVGAVVVVVGAVVVVVGAVVVVVGAVVVVVGAVVVVVVVVVVVTGAGSTSPIRPVGTPAVPVTWVGSARLYVVLPLGFHPGWAFALISLMLVTDDPSELRPSISWNACVSVRPALCRMAQAAP
jgi:hypothetical protein